MQCVPSTEQDQVNASLGDRVPQLKPPACLEFDSAGPDSWAWLHMAPFSVCGNAPDIVVDFRDIEDPWWKSGMEWDFVQLCGVE